MAAKHPSAPILYSFPDADTVQDALADYIFNVQEEAIASKRDKFTLAISGGSLPKMLKKLASKYHGKIKWGLW
jgi:6-phosphogluconolactonase